MVRMGVIGLGNMGSGHVGWIPKVRGAKLTAICDIVPSRLEKFDAPHKFASSADLIRSGTVDAVLISTPHYDHTTIGIDAMENGIHVLVEKPISVHKADCERIIAAQGEGIVFGAMFNQRTDPHYQRIRAIVQGGELGELQRFSWLITNWFRTASYYASGGWRATWGGEGGGVLMNQCPHNLDLLQWIVGMPSRLSAHASFGKYHDIEVEDEVTAYLEFPNGATGVFVTSTGEAPGTNRLEIVGDRGKLVYEGNSIHFTRTEVSVADFCANDPASFSTPAVWECSIPVSGYGGQHQEVVQNFVDAVETGVPLVAPAAEGIHSVELANAMLLSAWTHAPVQFPVDAVAYERALKEKIATSRFVKRVDERTSDLSGSVR